MGLQGGAILILFDVYKNKGEPVAFVGGLLKENPDNNAMLCNRLVRAIWQYHKIRRGWDWQQEEMIFIISQSITQLYLETRQYACKIAGYALKNGAGEYEEILLRSLEDETQQALRKEMQGYLK